VDSYLSYQSGVFGDCYTAVSSIKEMQLLARQKGADNYANLLSIGDIMFVLIMQKVTDTYGDVPYSQAGMAKEGIKTPVYDDQESIYNSMLATLDSSIAKLDPAGDVAAEDVFYEGNIPQWKKLGYSLMLRLAMRLTKINPDLAKTWAEKAAAGGTLAGNNDNAIILTDASNASVQNNTANSLIVDDVNVKWTKTFIDELKTDQDPRLSLISEVPATGSTDPAGQIGQPNGYDLNGGAQDVSHASNYPGSLDKYSHPKTAIYLQRNLPIPVLTYAQTELLLAEAAARGWNIPGSAATHYQNAQTASLAALAQLNAAAVVPGTAITAYTTAHPLDQSSLDNSLQDINTLYWVTTISEFNFYETWFNWKRSGYPALVPVVYPGNVTNGTIPRRMPYLSTEIITNGTNYNAAVAKIPEGDVLTGRTWWDKP
jgi:hypothetical protein